MSRTAAEIKLELDDETSKSLELDQQIEQLRKQQAEHNARRKTLEVEFQQQDAVEAQARLQQT
jgi:hypothetical protein